ncbi:MAG: hypothetical protein JNL43_00175 [Flavobacteriales bacterium]|nr:hypothetical protein [Flavobacteriales bacterium]
MRALLPILLTVLLASCFAPRGVRKAEVISADKEQAQVRLTGNIMLDGGCSPKPYWSLEMLSDTGWVTRVPFPGAQLLCGAGSWVYRKEVFNLQLGAYSPVEGPLLPGTYRFVLLGRNGRMKRTAEFTL